jgi:hypothetical protein
LLLDPTFEAIEMAYCAADALIHTARRVPGRGPPCPLAALIGDLERRLRLYAKLPGTAGADADVVGEIEKLVGAEGGMPGQILHPLTSQPRPGEPPGAWR